MVGPGAIGGVDEMYCKVDAVANELAMLDGYLSMFSFIPGLILAVPCGWLADKYGREFLYKKCLKPAARMLTL